MIRAEYQLDEVGCIFSEPDYVSRYNLCQFNSLSPIQYAGNRTKGD